VVNLLGYQLDARDAPDEGRFAPPHAMNSRYNRPMDMTEAKFGGAQKICDRLYDISGLGQRQTLASM
jgi:hypothetical protein